MPPNRMQSYPRTQDLEGASSFGTGHPHQVPGGPLQLYADKAVSADSAIPLCPVVPESDTKTVAGLIANFDSGLLAPALSLHPLR